MYLDDNELLELTIATMAEIDRYFFLMIECQKGRICYASSSVETLLGCKPVCSKTKSFFLFPKFRFSDKTELCLQSIFDIVYPGDIEIVKQQLINEKKTSSVTNEDSPSDSKCKINFCLLLKIKRIFCLAIPSLTTRPNCLEIGNRRTFSCRINSRKKRSNRPTTTNPIGKISFLLPLKFIFLFSRQLFCSWFCWLYQTIFFN